MLQKSLAIAALILLIGRTLYRPQWKAFGKRMDRFVNVAVVAIVLSYAGQLIYLWATGE